LFTKKILIASEQEFENRVAVPQKTCALTSFLAKSLKSNFGQVYIFGPHLLRGH